MSAVPQSVTSRPSAEIASYLTLFDDRFAEVEELLAGLDPAGLLWKPFEESPWKGTSSTLGFVLGHALSSTVYLLRRAEWVMRRIEWKEVTGDQGRDEFSAENHDPANMLDRCRRVRAYVHAQLPTYSTADLDATRPHERRPEVVFTARVEVVHALEHLSQHIGHAQLTRQLWENVKRKA